ncbi:thioesterase family protein [Pseudomonas sp. R5(2019)]|uniref:acyl-CoA thioesterase n=1 Tax=Pseudomonas sp. R5(2019) TaxID=2697566 RepID=UPI00141289E7|nr:thioesterase family protein [Pseudomonas sp. R5(2019)]NBA97507.1 acyl-CoA thioesterase [Pseudomonas sp. R5(2019)]
MKFTTRKIVRFAHCDPAGIVFYPRYAELCNEVVEDWFRDGLGIDFRHLQEVLRLTIPAVRLDVEFISPSVYEDVLEFSLEVMAIGRSSLSLFLVARCNNQERVRFSLKVVLVSVDTLRAAPINDQWRQRFSAYSN